IVVGNFSVLLHARFTAEVTSPMLDGAIQLGATPLIHQFMPRFTSRSHENKRVHERVIDRTLQIVFFAELIRLTSAAVPAFFRLMDGKRQRMVCERRGTVNDCATNVYSNRSGNVERTSTRLELNGEIGSVLCVERDRGISGIESRFHARFLPMLG